MKKYAVLWITVGLSLSILNPSSTQTVSDNNLLLLESNDSRTNDEEVLSNNSEMEQKIDEPNVSIESIDLPNYGEEVQIIIEENVKNPEQSDIDIASDSPFDLQDSDNLDNEIVPARDEDFYYNDLINKDPNEIMDTAAGFVPIPIFRRKKTQKYRKQFASRRYSRRPYPYRRMYYYFNPYYRYYYPSSLRYY